MKKIYIILLFFLICTNAKANNVSTWLGNEIDSILNAYKNDSLTKIEKFNYIENTVNDNFAGTGIAKFVAGKAWATADQETKMKWYSGQSYSFVNIIEDDQYKVIIVDMEIKDETSSMSMIVRWRIKQSKEKYYVIDLLIADISLIITKRSEFNSALKKNDYDLKIFNNILKEQNEISYSKIVQ